MNELLRTRWAAVGAAVAVTLGAGGVSLTQAAISSGDKPVFVPLEKPCRVIDTRQSAKIGAGDDADLTVQITGGSGDCTGPLAIPSDAVGVATNVTVIQPSDAASGRSYFTVYPADASRPVTSNLNFVNGQPPTPNKVDVGLSADGKIKIFNFEGSAHAAVDVFGYYVDHDHDDRYYTETETDARLAPLEARSGDARIMPFDIRLDRGETQEFAKTGPLSFVAACQGTAPASYPRIFARTTADDQVVMDGLDDFEGDLATGFLLPTTPAEDRVLDERGEGSDRSVEGRAGNDGLLMSGSGHYLSLLMETLAIGRNYAGSDCTFVGAYTYRLP